jgi:hypothetical protein
MKLVRKLLFFVLTLVYLLSKSVLSAMAKEGQVLGVHILNTHELDAAAKLIKNQAKDEWYYVTIPLTLSDLDKKDQWQDFFNKCKQQKIIPLVRLTTRPDGPVWKIPNKKETVDLIDFLSDLSWPTHKKHIIVFNEVNHAQEWGGKIDPAGYSKVLEFAANWAHTEAKNYIVLPAAMDLAATNGSSTIEAFNYLNQMYAFNPEIFSYVDAWNSHSYPNPDFSSSPEKTGKNSLRGFEYELNYLKSKTNQDYQVYITETGWIASGKVAKWLPSYYAYAKEHIWSHPQVVAVTPFVLKGDPGPFAGFTLIDKNDNPTIQYFAMRRAVEM